MIFFVFQRSDGIERFDIGISEKDTDNFDLLWSLNSEWFEGNMWLEGRVHFKSKSSEKTYEYAV